MRLQRCKNASNPYHTCSKYCHEQVYGAENADRSFALEKQAFDEQRAQCRNASNPHHQCSEYCIAAANERDVSSGSASQAAPSADELSQLQRDVAELKQTLAAKEAEADRAMIPEAITRVFIW